MLRRTALAAAMGLIAGAAALTNSAKANMDPAAFINNLGYQLQVVNTIASPELRLGRFRELFREDFDITGLGRFVLGRFWRVFDPLEQQEFLRLFEDYVVLTYSDRLSEYAGNGYRPRATGSRLAPDGVIVTSEIVRDSEPFRPQFSRSELIGASPCATASTRSATSSSAASAWRRTGARNSKAW